MRKKSRNSIRAGIVILMNEIIRTKIYLFYRIFLRGNKRKVPIFLFLAPNIVLGPIFVGNRTFLNFGGVGHGCGRSTGRRLSGPTFSDLSYRI